MHLILDDNPPYVRGDIFQEREGQWQRVGALLTESHRDDAAGQPRLLSGIGVVPAGLRRAESAMVTTPLLGSFTDHDFRSIALCVDEALEFEYVMHTEGSVTFTVTNNSKSPLANDTEFVVLAVRLE